jgi:protein O-GlcNAc transferase
MIAPPSTPLQSPSQMAEQALEQALEKVLQLALNHQQSGHLEEAESLYRSILQTRADHPQANHHLGLLAVQARQPEAGLPYLAAALEANPVEGSYWIGYIDALLQAGEIETARQVLEVGRQHGLEGNEVEAMARRMEVRVQSVTPPEAASTATARQGGKKAASTQAASKAKAASGKRGSSAPSQEEINTLVALNNSGRFAEMETLAGSLTQRFPKHGVVWKALGAAVQQQGRIAEALAPMQKAAELLPQDTEAHYNVGSALHELGRASEAETSYRRVLALKPDHAGAHNNLGNALKDLGRSAEAEKNFHRALQIKPDYVKAHNNLGTLLLDQNRLVDAEASLRHALVLKPDYAEAHGNLGVAMQRQALLKEAAASYRRALELKPDYAAAHSNLLFCLAHDDSIDEATLFAEHGRFGERFEAPLCASWPQHDNTREPQRCLRVGLVSADLRNHAVAHFIEPVLAQWADDASLALHVYYTHAAEDEVTQRLRRHAAHWHAVSALSDAALAEQIRADGIDILLDLSGHTAGNRLLTFARKPAPLQVSWIGYPGTTGLQAMDYYLADRHFLPPGRFDGQFTEKLVHLAVGLTFQPVADAPPVNALPALASGQLTFGSFNRLSKLSRPVVALWAQLLRAVPNARMVLGAMPEGGGGEALLDWFAQEGIGRERLVLHARCGMHAYLALHHQVDICLDTFPYTGGTTTLQALWMGVPTLTLAGRTPAGRQGATMLAHAGLEEFIAQDAAGFVRQGAAWAGRLEELARLRARLRERVAGSGLGQPGAMATGVAAALRLMWQRWCAGEAPTCFEVPLEGINAIEAALWEMWESRRGNVEAVSVTSTAAQALEQALEKALQLALSHQQSGRLEEAESLYRTILQTRSDHPQANHHLGLLAVQARQPEAGLPYLAAALEANPVESSYWIGYIDALLQAGEVETARQVLALGRQHGLEGGEVEALAGRLDTGLPSVTQTESASMGAGQQGSNKPASAKAVPKAKVAPGKKGGGAPSQEEITTLVALNNSGRFAEMETLARSLTQRFPKLGIGWKALGAALQQLGRLAEALAPMQKAVELLPQDAETYTNLGIVLQQQGWLVEAEENLRRALRLKPELAAAHFNLGNTLKEQRRCAEAEASFCRTLQIKPDFAEAHVNLGVIAEELERFQEAEATYRKALEIRPNYAEAHGHLGTLLKDLAQLPEAETSLRRALALKEDYAEVHNNLGIVLRSQGRFTEAEANLRRAVEIKPDYAEAYNNLGIVLKGLARLHEAEANLRRALELEPDYAEAHSNLGSVLMDQGRLKEAAEGYGRALQIKPDYAHGHSNLLFCLAHDDSVDEATLFAEHGRFGAHFEAPLCASWPQHDNTREPQRCLRVGLVSADLRNHAVAHFIEPVLAQWADDASLALHVYYTHAAEDEVTQRLRRHAAHWHAVSALSDAALAEQIRADGIDILLDLSGHTAGNRLLTFARKPAPLQVSWIGYPGTTGLQAMDYYLADRHFLPPGRFDGQFTEKLVHLAVGLTFQPVADAPPVNALPALASGQLTFGSFNRLSKLSRPVVALWAQLLRAVPNARMVLGAMPEGGGGEALLDWFAQEGIGRERLVLHARCGMHAYLALHHQVDICLDTFPYTGGTTTLQALWMGVPTLTLAGRTPAGRQGATMLAHAGLEEFIAQDAAGFVRQGAAWAGRLEELARLRARLRERVAGSGLGQPGAMATGVAAALRLMWQRWCAGEAPRSFEVALHDTDKSIQEGNP